MTFQRTLIAAGLALAGSSAFADATRFSDFTPMTGDVGEATLPEAAPYRLSSPKFSQMTIVARGTNPSERFDSGNYDMHTANETGPDAGRYLFTVFETDQAGIQRTDLRTMITTTIWSSPAKAPALNSHVAFDASRWTPWGSFLTAEESWSDPGANPPSIYGRLFEVTNPLAAPEEINMVHRNILPRVSHEGLAFDRNNNLYFIDERNDSFIFKYTSRNPNATSGDEFFSAGQTFVLRVADGLIEEATGPAVWVPLTDKDGNPLSGAVVVTDANGVTSIDGRATPKLMTFKGTQFDRPEDLEVRTVQVKDNSYTRRKPRTREVEQLFVATTTNHKVFSIDLTNNTVKLFASQNSLDMATGVPVGTAFKNPDNVAVDSEGNMYIVEDQPGGVEDIWFAKDEDKDGVAESIGKWASLSTKGAESTGLYFDRFEKNLAYINVQHPDSGVDRTIMLRTPAYDSENMD